MWFATFDGLNRYDGYNFRVYRNEPGNENSLMHDVLRTLLIDSDGILWIGTRGGLSRYVEKYDHFRNFACTAEKGNALQVNALLEISDGRLLAGTEEGLKIFDKQKEQFVDSEQFRSVHAAVQSLAKQGPSILIGTTKGLMVYNTNLKTLGSVHSVFEGLVIQAILPQSDSRIWIGTEGEGLFMLNMQSGEVINFRHNPADPESLSSNYVRSLALDAQFQLWVGTFNALSIKANGEEAFLNLYHDPTRESSISQNSIRSIYMDTQGGMWLGSYYGGINYYHPLKNKFDHLQQNPYTRSLNDKVISCMVEDPEGRMWIGTNDNGINIYNPKNNTFEYITNDNRPVLVSNNIKAFLLSNDNTSLYAGTHGGGLLKINKATKAVRRIAAANRLLNDVYALSYDQWGKLWVGTLTGLYQLNESDDTFSKINISSMGSEQVFYLKKDSKGRMWIGGEKSIGVFTGSKLRVFNSDDYNGTVVNSAVNCIFEDSKKRIWIGTRGGLNLFNENGTFSLYNKENGLPGNMIYGILEDSFGRLWISTNEGLTNFNPQNQTFRNYSEADGLEFRQFNMYSFCQSRSGLMYFGGINGITRFYPELLIDNPHTPGARIARILVQNKEVRPYDESGILTDHILNTRKIKLNSHQQGITIELFVPNYLAGQHNIFSYQLEGFDDEWIVSNDQRQVTYTNLNPGTYTFKVKAANNDGKWNEEITELEIVVLPPWWRTWWAVLLFSGAAGYGVWFVLRFLNQRRLMNDQLEKERHEKEKMEEMNQMKTRFFINISHEFRTPLTLILSPLQDLIERTTDKWQRSQLAHIQKNTNKMLHLVNQLMDYRRAELGFFELKVHRINLRKQVSEITGLFEKAAKRKRFTFTTQYFTQEENVLADANYFELILTNLLSNSFKFTPDGGVVTVQIEEDLDYLIVEVQDSGCGIPETKLDLIFDRFYQVNMDHMGTGIGLSLVKRLVDMHHGKIEVKSKVGEGSVFTVYLPQNPEIYTPDELVTDEITGEGNLLKTPTLDFIDDDSEKVSLTTTDQPVLQNETILIAEDNSEVMEYLAGKLSAHYRVLKAANGQEALELLKTQEVDMVLTDVMMPVMDGIKLCRFIKQNIKTCHIPVILLSARSTTEDQLEGLEVGADDYVPKPFTYSVLKMKIQNMLKARQRSQEYYSKTQEVEPEKITFNAMDEELLRKALAVVNKNLDNSEFSTDMFCAEMGMSRSNLHLKLKAITGESTIDFIRKVRFNEACKLLLNGRYNVAEVSTMVGFNTPSYFATSFRKYYGCLPTEYVKSRRL